MNLFDPRMPLSCALALLPAPRSPRFGQPCPIADPIDKLFADRQNFLNCG